MKRDWEELTATLYYESVAEIKGAFEEHDLDEVRLGLDSLLEAMSQDSRRALKSQLVRLMLHVIKWKIQPEKRTRSWLVSINHARYSIEDIREDKPPSLTRRFIEENLWRVCFQRALREAQDETGSPETVESLTWEEVFENRYRLPNE